MYLKSISHTTVWSRSSLTVPLSIGFFSEQENASVSIGVNQILHFIKKGTYVLSINMKERIRQILEWTNLSQQDFANRLGISPASLSSIFTGRTNPTNNHVQAIHRSFPDINVNWLMFGEGHMMNSEEIVDRSLSGNDVVGGSDNVVSGGENREMASMFTEDDYRDAPMNDVYAHKSEDGYRQGYQGRPSGFQYLDNTKKNDKKMRKIKEIRVFFDDGTYEAFVPSTSK